MELITPVSNSIAIFAGLLMTGVAVMLFSVALARISIDLFQRWSQ